MKRLYLRPFMFLLPFALGACGFNDWANTHMPVIGERCESWQCFTEGGQEQSRLNQQQRVAEQSNAYATGESSTAIGPAPAKPPAQALAPATPEGGAYQYVPRAPAAPGTTPFEGAQ